MRPGPKSRFRCGNGETGPGDDYTPAEIEFMMAMDRYKRENNRPHPSWLEVLNVAKDLGYRKVDR